MAQAKRKASAKASANLPQSADIPAGMKQIGSGNAPTWKPEEGEALNGTVTQDVKIVEFTNKRKVKGKMVEETTERRVFELTDEEGQRHAIWESAALVELFDIVAENGVGTGVFIRFDGYGKKKPGQNAPKLFTVAVAA